jgi:ATP-dependent protease ClpP protease subunit
LKHFFPARFNGTAARPFRCQALLQDQLSVRSACSTRASWTLPDFQSLDPMDNKIMLDAVLPATAFKKPAVALSGVVDYAMYVSFRQQFDNASSQDLVVIELSTLGGDPEVARMMGEDVRFASETEPQRRFVFLGKAAIYSAGTTFMSFFVRENRYLTRGTRLMIHERKLSKELVIDGPLTTCLATVQATLNEIECSIAIQNEGFQNLIVGSSVTLDEVLRRAPSNWYLEAQEALNMGLIAAVL